MLAWHQVLISELVSADLLTLSRKMLLGHQALSWLWLTESFGLEVPGMTFLSKKLFRIPEMFDGELMDRLQNPEEQGGFRKCGRSFLITDNSNHSSTKERWKRGKLIWQDVFSRLDG